VARLRDDGLTAAKHTSNCASPLARDVTSKLIAVSSLAHHRKESGFLQFVQETMRLEQVMQMDSGAAFDDMPNYNLISNANFIEIIK
jgi:hypothetical protein